MKRERRENTTEFRQPFETTGLLVFVVLTSGNSGIPDLYLDSSTTRKCNQRMRQLAIAIVFILCLGTGCTHLFFYPTKDIYPQLAEENPKREMIDLKSRDGVRLQGMRLLSETKPVGVILQLHGNAQNISSHYQFVSWLAHEGWEVLTFDYRGYGQSDSSIGWFHGDLEGVLGDSISAIDWADRRAAELGVPLVIIGQSLGGALTLRSLVDLQPTHLKMIVIDSSFFSFRSIAQEKLDSTWLTWILGRLVPLLVSDTLSPGPRLESFQRDLRDHPLMLPAVFIHSQADPVVSKRQGDLILEAYPGPKEQWVLDEPGHIRGLTQMPIRERLLARLKQL